MSNEGLAIAKPSYFDSVDTWTKALSVGVLCYTELHRVLVKDAVDGQDSFIGNMKITTGLERSLQELNERHPNLMKEIHSTSLLVNGVRVFRC